MINNNIIFEKIWQNGDLIELKITAISEYVHAFQNCYVKSGFLREISNIISEYIKDYKNECYIEFGKKEGNFTPAFSMKLLPADFNGYVKIEVDLEIADNDKRAHRCCFYVSSELGLVERMGKEIRMLDEGKLGELFSLDYIE